MNNFTTSLYPKAARSSRISLTLSWHWLTKPTLWQSSAWVKLKSPPHPYMKQTSRTVSDDTASKGHHRTAVLTNQNDGGRGQNFQPTISMIINGLLKSTQKQHESLPPYLLAMQSTTELCNQHQIFEYALVAFILYRCTAPW